MRRFNQERIDLNGGGESEGDTHFGAAAQLGRSKKEKLTHVGIKKVPLAVFP